MAVLFAEHGLGGWRGFALNNRPDATSRKLDQAKNYAKIQNKERPDGDFLKTVKIRIIRPIRVRLKFREQIQSSEN